MSATYTDRDREALLDEARRIGESLAEVARRRGVAPQTAYGWARRRRRKPVAGDEPEVEFARVVREGSELDGDAIELVVGAARVVVRRGFDGELLRQLVAALSEREEP